MRSDATASNWRMPTGRMILQRVFTGHTAADLGPWYPVPVYNIKARYLSTESIHGQLTNKLNGCGSISTDSSSIVSTALSRKRSTVTANQGVFCFQAYWASLPDRNARRHLIPEIPEGNTWPTLCRSGHEKRLYGRVLLVEPGPQLYALEPYAAGGHLKERPYPSVAETLTITPGRIMTKPRTSSSRAT